MENKITKVHTSLNKVSNDFATVSSQVNAISNTIATSSKPSTSYVSIVAKDPVNQQRQIKKPLSNSNGTDKTNSSNQKNPFPKPSITINTLNSSQLLLPPSTSEC
jgi:hypothetical protein